jgi:two-component system, NtrC family, sensor kinase
LVREQNKVLEEKVHERTTELETSLETLKATQNQLIQSEKLANLGELTAGISHEIQNPLNFVTNFSELSVDLVKDLKDELAKSPLTPEGGIIISSKDKAYFDELFADLASNQEKIKHHGRRASSIVKGMLEHSRASTGIREHIDINQLADEYLRLSYHGLRAKDKTFNAEFKTDFADSLPKIAVIPQDLGRVLLNLINNAFYAVNQRNQAPQPPEGEHYVPTVTVSTHLVASPSGTGGAQIIIKVKDNGTGMPESVKTKIFQPFFSTKPTGEGTGLGLSLAYDIVTKGHGGTLAVESTEGIGTTFTLTLST